MSSSKVLRKHMRRARALSAALLYAVYRLSIWTKQKLHLAHGISQARAEFLADSFTGFSVEGSTATKKLFETITKPAELHYLAHIHNWDDGPEVLHWISNSNYCDQGTAALIFWRSQPDFYQEYADESEMSLPDGILPLLQGIMHHWERSFYQRQQIAYDRREDLAAGKYYPDNSQGRWSVPDYLLMPTKGKPFLLA